MYKKWLERKKNEDETNQNRKGVVGKVKITRDRSRSKDKKLRNN